MNAQIRQAVDAAMAANEVELRSLEDMIRYRESVEEQEPKEDTTPGIDLHSPESSKIREIEKERQALMAKIRDLEAKEKALKIK